MADKITITAPFSQDARSLGRIGRVGENISRQIVFDCTSVLTDHPNANIVCAIQRPGDKQPYAAQLTRVGSTGEFKLELTSTEVAVSGSVRFELRMVDGDEILKAAICTGTVETSMAGIGDTPGEPIADALNRLETAIAEVGNYADLNATKQDKLIAGTGITIAEDGKTISASGGGSTPQLDVTKCDIGVLKTIPFLGFTSNVTISVPSKSWVRAQATLTFADRLPTTDAKYFFVLCNPSASSAPNMIVQCCPLTVRHVNTESVASQLTINIFVYNDNDETYTLQTMNLATVVLFGAGYNVVTDVTIAQ